MHDMQTDNACATVRRYYANTFGLGIKYRAFCVGKQVDVKQSCVIPSLTQLHMPTRVRSMVGDYTHRFSCKAVIIRSKVASKAILAVTQMTLLFGNI